MKSFSKQILKGGTKELIDKIGGVSNNQTFVIIVCLILAAYSARVSQGYTLPTSLYPLFDNIFAKIITFIVIIIISQFNKSISIMLILSYVLLLIAYYKQNGIEGFEDIFFRFTTLKNIEGFTQQEEEGEGETNESFMGNSEEEGEGETNESFMGNSEEERLEEEEQK